MAEGALAPVATLPVPESKAADIVALAPPAAAETKVLELAAGETYRIDADPEAVELGFEAKDVVLRFPDEGRLVFPGLVALAETGEAPLLRVGDLELDGDTLLGQAMLQTDQFPPLVTGSAAMAPEAAAPKTATKPVEPGGVTTIERPPPGQTLAIESSAGETYEIAFDPTEAQLAVIEDDILLIFEDGARVVFRDFMIRVAEDSAPTLRVGGTDIGGDVIVQQALTLLQPGAGGLETAAGAGPEALTRDYSGFGAYLQEARLAESARSETAAASAPEALFATLNSDALAPSAPPEGHSAALAGAGLVEHAVFYATDRLQEGFAAEDYRFTEKGAPGGILSFGRLVVAAPKIAAAQADGGWGSLELDRTADAGFELVRIDPMWRSAFRDRLSAEAGRDVLVLAHGPGLSFAQAAARIVALAQARGFQGSLMLYSWPAEGGDAGNALIGRNLDRVVTTLRTQAPDAAIHLVAHPALAGAVAPFLEPPAGGGGGGQALYWRLGG